MTLSKIIRNLFAAGVIALIALVFGRGRELRLFIPPIVILVFVAAAAQARVPLEELLNQR